MNYGAKAGTNYEGLQIASLPPGIYKNYELTDVKADSATKSDGTTGKNIITFLFEGAEGPFQHTEWEVLDTDTDAQKKADNMEERIGHILSKYVSKEILATNASTSWTSYTAWIMQTLGVSYKGVKVDFKIIGNVFKGKAKSDFPGYKGFIVKSGEPLSFSASEKASNDAWFKFNDATPDKENTPSAGATANVDPDF